MLTSHPLPKVFPLIRIYFLHVK
uniref:Uncharacterized protein n=1 Tax=Rhizophora mucronata TaxID=61149 RepID=A0A2P2PYJ8_RHIMU